MPFPAPDISVLTPTQLEVVRLFAQGHSVSAIARIRGRGREAITAGLAAAQLKLGFTEKLNLLAALQKCAALTVPAVSFPDAGRWRRALSAWELQILRLAGEGYSNAQIARLTGKTGRAVICRLHDALRKAGVPDRNRLVIGYQQLARAGRTRAIFGRPSVPPLGETPAEDAMGRLTKREKLAANLVADGLDGGEIAAALGWSRTVVASVVARARHKLGAKDDIELILLLQRRRNRKVRSFKAQPDARPLAPVETEIAHLVGQGRRIEEIARFRGCTCQTLYNRLPLIIRKLGFKNRRRFIARYQELKRVGRCAELFPALIARTSADPARTPPWHRQGLAGSGAGRVRTGTAPARRRSGNP